MNINIVDPRNRKIIKKELSELIDYLGNEILKENFKNIHTINIEILLKYPTAREYDIAFSKLYSNGTINLIITPFYNKNKKQRVSLIAHEFTHVKQMMDGELKFNLNKKEYFYKNKMYTKVYSFDYFDKLETREEQIEYVSGICPWEYEPSINADKYYLLCSVNKI